MVVDTKDETSEITPVRSLMKNGLKFPELGMNEYSGMSCENISITKKGEKKRYELTSLKQKLPLK